MCIDDKERAYPVYCSMVYLWFNYLGLCQISGHNGYPAGNTGYSGGSSGAIPVIIIHGMLKSLAKSKFGQAEGVALSMLNGTTELEDAAGKEPSHEEPEDLDLDEAELI